MIRPRLPIRFGRDSVLWPALLLVLVVLVPTACVLWLLGEATQNERLAVRQLLDEAYRTQLSAIRDRCQMRWEDRLTSLRALVQGRPAAEAFAQSTHERLADSLLVFDASGDPIYPSPTVTALTEPLESDHRWQAAERREYIDLDPIGAAAAYRDLASTAPADVAARALQAEARCLLRAGQTDAALWILAEELQGEPYHAALDRHGRWIAADADLRVLQVAGGQSPQFTPTLERLVARLNDYRRPLLRSGQRLFLMRELAGMLNDDIHLPTRRAEELASHWLASQVTRPTRPAATSIGNGIWQISVPDVPAIALFHSKTLLSDLQAAIRSQRLPAGTAVIPLSPGEGLPAGSEFLSLPLGNSLPGWRLALSPMDDNALSPTSGQRTRYYVSTALLMVLTTTALAVLIGSAFRRQMRLTQLKNDLVATVSHELKTPLSSIRLLVDTLLDAEEPDPVRDCEYLQLIARENARLSRLIDNFLTFSRLERGKQSFDFSAVEPAAVVDRTWTAVRERVASAGASVKLDLTPGLPHVWADADALVTVLVNLLDNALKYTGEDKQIVLRVTSAPDAVHFAVLDNGIGLDPREARRVFDRFYQVDRRLSRASEGCGLGLSIVRSIVQAHGGRVRVDSRPGQGSTFTFSVRVAGEV